MRAASPLDSSNSFFTGKSAAVLLGAAAIVGVVWAIYQPALHGTWLWDDGYEVANNSALREPGGLLKIWTGEGARDYFPLKGTLQWLGWQAWGANPTGWHALNLAFHAANALLLWRLLQRLGLRLAWLGALLFAIHPLAVESVAWIAEFKNLVSTSFALLTFLAYLDFDDEGRPAQLWRAVGWFLAAMLSKSTVVMLPFALGLYLLWKHGSIDSRKRWSLVPFFAVGLILGLVTVWFQSERAIEGANVPVGNATTRVARAGLAVLFYVKQALWPTELMPIYPRWSVDPPPPYVFFAWPVLAGFFFCLWRTRHGHGRHLLFGAGAFALLLVPILGFIAMAYMHVGWVSDHFAYVALPAAVALLAGGIGWIVQRVTGAGRKIAMGAVAAMFVTLSAISWSYAGIFRSAPDLWRYAVAHNPDSAAAQSNLGIALASQGALAEARVHLEAALRLDPDSPYARENLRALDQALPSPHP